MPVNQVGTLIGVAVTNTMSHPRLQESEGHVLSFQQAQSRYLNRVTPLWEGDAKRFPIFVG